MGAGVVRTLASLLFSSEDACFIPTYVTAHDPL